LPLHSSQVAVEVVDACLEFLDPGREFVNGFCLPTDDGMARGKIIGQFHRDGGHRDASLHG
jgi:hypothetical protein